MHARIRVPILLAAVLVGGCVFENESNDSDKQYDVHDYLPSELAGTIYSWHSETLSLIELETDTISYTETISGPETIDGKQVYSITTPGEPLIKRFYIENNSIMMRTDSNVLDWFDDGSLAELLQPEYFKLFDFSTSIGDTYDVFDKGATFEDSYGNFLVKAKRLEHETVTTPAGTFTDCPLFKIDYSMTITPIVTGDTMRYTWTEEYWFGENTGPIKRQIKNYLNYIPTDTTTEEVTQVSRIVD